MSRPIEEYQTQNGMIATMLHTLGVPWIKDVHGEERRVLNIYTVQKLRELGYDKFRQSNGERHTLESGARQAFADGKHGILIYSFKSTPLQEELCAAWATIEEAINAQDAGNLSGVGSKDIAQLELDPKAAAALLCQFAKNRRLVVNAWKMATPYIMAGEMRKEKGAVEGSYEIVGSYKIVSLDASSEVRKRVGL